MDKALLVGLNKYESVPDLRGCENDVRIISQLLVEQYGFQDSNIVKLLNEDAIKRNVVQELETLTDGAKPGERLVFHFSGHGSYRPSENDDEEVDEIICFYDMDWDAPSTFLIDDELGDLLARIVPENVQLTVVLDACHSATGTRQLGDGKTSENPLMIISDTVHVLDKATNFDIDKTQILLEDGDAEFMEIVIEKYGPYIALARTTERDTLYRALRRRRRVRRFTEYVGRNMNHQLIASASEDQIAADAHIADDFYGAFSYYLCKSARSLGAQQNLREIVRETTRALRVEGYSQTPQIEGPYSDRPLFGTRNGYSATPSQPAGALGSTVHSVEIIENMLRVAEKFIDLTHALLDSGSHTRNKTRGY